MFSTVSHIYTQFCKWHAAIPQRDTNIHKLTFEEPICVPLFGTVGFKKRKNILGNVFHHPSGERGIVQIWDVLCFYHLVFLLIRMEAKAVHVYIY